MTSYHLEAGYNSGHAKEDVAETLLAVAKAICAQPELILAEVKRVEGLVVAADFAESYREPWQDATIKIIQGERLQVMQLASGGGEARDYKEAMRRAFCRLVIERMHREQMEVNLIVA